MSAVTGIASKASGGALTRAWHAVRARSEALAAPLTAEDCAVQSMADASPVKWHLAHTSWFFETVILAQKLGKNVIPVVEKFTELELLVKYPGKAIPQLNG